MQPITLEAYFDADNPWTHRLLGNEPFQQDRTRDHLRDEWDGDYYRDMLEKHRYDLQPLRDLDLSRMTGEIVISMGDQLFRAPLHLIVGIRRHFIKLTLQRFANSPLLCDLGAGYGNNLLWLRNCLPQTMYGGEFSANARELARRLDVDITAFDYYEPDSYRFIRPDSTVYTSHSIEQIPDAGVVIEGLRSVAHNINRVIHFEPVHVDGRDSLLGQMRQRYVELNDYNRNLLSVLQTAPDIRIIHSDLAVYGINPLNPTSIVVWEFA